MKVSEAKLRIDNVIESLECMIDDPYFNNVTMVMNYQHTMGKYHGILDNFYESEDVQDFVSVHEYRKEEIDKYIELFNNEYIEPLYRLHAKAKAYL